MITRKNESKIIAKHISFKCKSDGIKYKSNQKWNKMKCWYECKKSKKISCVWKRFNPSTFTYENSRFLKIIIHVPVITWDEIIETTKPVQINNIPTNFNEKRSFVQRKSYIFYLPWLS